MIPFETRFNKKIIFYTIAGLVITPLLSLALVQVFAAVIFILFIFDKYGNKAESFDIFVYLICAFVVIRILSIIFSQYPEASQQSYYKEALFYTTFFALTYYFKVLDFSFLKKIYRYTVLAGVLVSVIGIILFISGSVDRAQSFGSGYSVFSTYLLVILTLLISYKYKEENLKEYFYWALQVSLVFTGIILSLGRANIAIALSLGALLIFVRRINYKPVLMIILFTFIFSFISFQFNSNEFEKRVDNPTTLSDRDIIIEGFLLRSADHPFLGYGPRTFHQIFPYKERLADKDVGSWHNDYLQTYVESGMFALIIIILLYFFILWKGKKYLFGRVREKEKAEYITGVLYGLIAIGLSGLTGINLYSPVTSLLFAILLSLFSSLIYIKNQSEGQAGITA